MSTKSILGFVDGAVCARLLCVYATVMPSPALTPNKSVATSSTDCLTTIRALLLRGGGRMMLVPRLYVPAIVTRRGNGTHLPDGHCFEVYVVEAVLDGGSTIGLGSPISAMREIRCCFKASATSLCDRRPARLCSSYGSVSRS